MKILISIIISILTAMSGCLPVSNRNETTNFSQNINSYYPDSTTVALAERVNEYRVANGLNPLVLDPELCQLAYIRAQEQAETKGHQRPNGERFYTVFYDYDLRYNSYGENIVLSSGNNVEGLFNSWKTSITHDKNMLDAKWDKTGIALYVTDGGKHCFVQLFVGGVK